jgi:hypothetical protein
VVSHWSSSRAYKSPQQQYTSSVFETREREKERYGDLLGLRLALESFEFLDPIHYSLCKLAYVVTHVSRARANHSKKRRHGVTRSTMVCSSFRIRLLFCKSYNCLRQWEMERLLNITSRGMGGGEVEWCVVFRLCLGHRDRKERKERKEREERKKEKGSDVFSEGIVCIWSKASRIWRTVLSAGY